MAGTGASSPYIKEETDDQFFSNRNNTNGQRFQQGFNMPQQHFGQFANHGGSINPSDLTMNGNGVAISNGGGNGYGSSYQNNFNTPSSGAGATFSKGISTFGDDELLDSLGAMNESNSNQGGMQSNGQDFGMEFDFGQAMYSGNNGASSLSVDPNHLNGYSGTPDGEHVHSPFVHNFNQAQFRNMQQQQNFSSSLQSPASYSGSAQADLQTGSVDNYTKQRPNLSQVMQGRKSSATRSPLTSKTPAISSLNIGSAENSSFASEPIRTSQSHRGHQKTLSGQWDHTPSSMASFPGSEFSSPVHGVHPNAQISDILKGASMPTNLNGHSGASTPALQSQEMKRRRRRESHNLVERRRRDNINERIQELSHLVPLHRLEDEKVRKALQNNSPLSPTLAGLSAPPNEMSPPRATSGLAGPGARRATAGNITTGIPIEEKDKGPNKGDILNGAVSWTRDLMWMLHLKLQQQEDLANMITELGGTFPFEQTEDEKRMHTELMDAMIKNDGGNFSYSRHPGSGLRVPKHTDIKGEHLNPSPNGLDASLSPDNHSTGDAGQTGIGGAGQYWSGHNSGGSGAGSITFKEEDEYGMDLTQ